jgi:Domain of unknown function (DUF4276)
MKFVLFVEGHTEDKALPQFLKKWLDQRLPKPVGIKAVRFEGWAQLYKDAATKAKMHLNGPGKDDLLAVISLLDLYGPTIYPADKVQAQARHDWAKQHIEQKVGHPKFFQFFAGHEVEAWLLAEPAIFPLEIKRRLADKAKPPETINHHEPPAKLLNRLYTEHTGRGYKKVVHGKALFSALDPNLAYQQCPNLRLLLDKMLALASHQANCGTSSA